LTSQVSGGEKNIKLDPIIRKGLRICAEKILRAEGGFRRISNRRKKKKKKGGMGRYI